MKDYASYQFYKDTYKGKLNMPLFLSFIPRASREIDKAVNRPITEEDLANNQIRWVACELVDYLQSAENSKGSVSAVSIDGVSKTYLNKTPVEIKRDIQGITDGLPQDLVRFL